MSDLRDAVGGRLATWDWSVLGANWVDGEVMVLGRQYGCVGSSLGSGVEVSVEISGKAPMDCRGDGVVRVLSTAMTRRHSSLEINKLSLIILLGIPPIGYISYPCGQFFQYSGTEFRQACSSSFTISVANF